MKKLFVFLVFLFVFSFLVIGVVGQTEYVIDSMETTLSVVDIKAIYSNNGSSVNAGLGQSFVNTIDDRWLSSCGFYLRKQGSPVGVLKAVLFDWNTHEVLEYSVSSVAMESLTTLSVLTNFSFGGDYLLLTGQRNYTIGVVVFSASTLGSSDYVDLRYSGTEGSPDADGFMYILENSDWVKDSNGDLSFEVRGNDAPATTPTPSPSPSPSPAVTQDVVPQTPFVSVPSYYMVLLVLFAVVAVLVGLYVTFEREQSNKGVALLFVLVGLVVFVVLIVGYFVGF